MSSSTRHDDPPEQAGMTLEEMQTKYKRLVVEDARLNRNYVKNLQETIEKHQRLIDEGAPNSDLCKEYIEHIRRTRPPAPPIDPDEPQGLDNDVKWRMRVLKWFLEYLKDDGEWENHIAPKGEDVDIEAVLEAYRKGTLKVNDDEFTVWYAGQLVMGPLPREALDKEAVYQNKARWEAEFGPGRVWIEVIEESAYML
ncbi:hypothetical protein F5884DRAFT_494263 [Xylogone sp. PMI_703]|nr:hypothetical protein F5884DRAFT_494263 [Xylogone sp. PMI_703]